MAECLFCAIAAHEVDAAIVRETDEVVAFEDINPQAPTHLLAIPRRHVTSVSALASDDAALLGELFETLAGLAEERGLQGGYRIVTNTGRDAGQSVDHLHFHLLGGRSLQWPPG